MVCVTLNFLHSDFSKEIHDSWNVIFEERMPILPRKIFKLLNKREERPNNVGETVVIFPHIYCETLGSLVRLVGITKA